MKIEYFIEQIEDGYILNINGKRYACESFDMVKNKIYESYRSHLQRIAYGSAKTMSISLQITENPPINDTKN